MGADNTPRAGSRATDAADDLAWDANFWRRDMTRDARIMLTAKRYPDPEKGGRGKVSDKLAEIFASFGVSKGHAKDLLSEARKVVAFLPKRADEVIAAARIRLAGAFFRAPGYSPRLRRKRPKRSLTKLKTSIKSGLPSIVLGSHLRAPEIQGPLKMSRYGSRLIQSAALAPKAFHTPAAV
jgi:hypothetical protein